MAEIGNIHLFTNANKLNAFAGIDPTQSQSGNKSSTNEKISKRGSPHLRKAIYSAAFIASTHDVDMRLYYQKKISEGKHHYVALAGIARKLLNIIYSVLTEDRDYIKK